MQKLSLLVRSLLHKLVTSDNLKRVLHTFWQAGLGALVTGLVAVHSTADVKAVLFTALTTGFAAVKSAVVAKRG